MNAIEFNNISKQYRLGQISTGTISHDLNRWWARFRGKEDPYLRVGEVNDRSKKGVSDYVWALRDIDFSVEQGDVVGIIGKNGAGKSTLLKILSKITAPTTGEIRARGRIASLLEVGTGFHPEMTGRENIYMNGAIMGMTRAEITRKLDEIVDFAGVERYLDTPVKRYSSGMMVRLGFAVAAHLEPEILVVDEVLAVGDAEFQKKAIGKMQEVSRGDGRTVLFVSHNMGAVKNLCKSGIVLNNGNVSFTGSAHESVNFYLKEKEAALSVATVITHKHRGWDYSKDVEVLSVAFVEPRAEYASNEPISIYLDLKGNVRISDFILNGTVFDDEDIPVGGFFGRETFDIQEGQTKRIQIDLINHNLSVGTYFLSFSVGKGDFTEGKTDYDIVHKVLVFRVDCFDRFNNVAFSQWNKGWGKILFLSSCRELNVK